MENQENILSYAVPQTYHNPNADRQPRRGAMDVSDIMGAQSKSNIRNLGQRPPMAPRDRTNIAEPQAAQGKGGRLRMSSVGYNLITNQDANQIKHRSESVERGPMRSQVHHSLDVSGSKNRDQSLNAGMRQNYQAPQHNQSSAFAHLDQQNDSYKQFSHAPKEAKMNPGQMMIAGKKGAAQQSWGRGPAAPQQSLQVEKITDQSVNVRQARNYDSIEPKKQAFSHEIPQAVAVQPLPRKGGRISMNKPYEIGLGGNDSTKRAKDNSMTAQAPPVHRVSANVYANGSNQNCGNVLTDKPTSRVLAPPGGFCSKLW